MSHVLIIDDNPHYRNLLAAVLRQAGHEVTTAENGRVGLEQFTARAADLVLTDMMMPEQGGVETILKLRKLAPRLPILAMTGSEQSLADVILPAAVNLGATQTFVKPVAIKELLKAVAELTGAAPAADAVAIKLLLLEDNTAFVNLITTVLRTDPAAKYEVTCFDQLQSGLDHLNREPVDVILTDLGLRDSSGLETFKRLHQHAPAIPIVVLTGSGDDNMGLEAVRGGAQDYLIKGQMEIRWFPRILRHAIERKRTERELQKEKTRTDALLGSLLPGPIAEQIKRGEPVVPRLFEQVNVLFADLVGFTSWSARLPPDEIVYVLNQIFSAFDQLAQSCGMEKIKTIGDAYMAVAGLPVPRPDGAQVAASLALGILRELETINQRHGSQLKLRIGIATGPVVAGIIGLDKIHYDLWGDTVNTASRMESHGTPGRIHVCSATYECLRESHYFEKREMIEVKGKGAMQTWFLTGRKFDGAG